MADHTYAIYILASTYHHLYIGVTGHLEQRIATHKAATNTTAFTAQYRINRLVHIERFRYINNALARETQLNSWTRLKKIALIVEGNPTWRDLSLDWGSPIPPSTTTTMQFLVVIPSAARNPRIRPSSRSEATRQQRPT